MGYGSAWVGHLLHQLPYLRLLSMIEKIESEILDSCESVTFDDIAGL